MIRIHRENGWYAIVLVGGRAAMGAHLKFAVARFRAMRRELWICETRGRR